MSGIQGTFITAVQGMNTQARALNRISNNIANVATTGYKTEQYHFETLMNHVAGDGKKYFAVKSMDFRDVDQQGQIATTTRTLDLALNGRGFLVTNTADQRGGATGNWQYTRDGALFGRSALLDPTDPTNTAVGTLLTTSNGNYVYGWRANDDGTFTETNDLSALEPVMYATDQVLPSQATTTISLQGNLSSNGTNPQTVSLPYIDSSGTSQSLTLKFTQRQLEIIDDPQSGLTNKPLSTWNIEVSSTNGIATLDGADFVGFDGQGKLVDSNGDLIVDPDNPDDGLIGVTLDDGSGPQTISIDLNRLTQLADNGSLVVQQIDQDGYIAGYLQNAYFTSEGVLVGSYSNHEVRNLYKLPVATFPSNSNLEAIPGNMFIESHESGGVTLRGLGNSLAGTSFVTGALERSTVDLSDQFARMIVTQRAYSSSAQVLRTADEMTMAARDLKR